MTLMLQKYTLDHSAWQTVKRGKAGLLMTPGASALHTPELVSAQGPQKTPSGQGGFPWDHGQEAAPWPLSLGSGMVLGITGMGTCFSLREMRRQQVHGAVNESLCMAVVCLEGWVPPWCWHPLSWNRHSDRDQADHQHFRVVIAGG